VTCTLSYFFAPLDLLYQGHRLGNANEATSFVPSGGKIDRDENIPEPIHNPNLTDDQREKQREERLAAVLLRQKKQGGPPKKKKTASDAPLTGPNSKPLMTWQAG
jgi:hypothetical protein